MIKVLVPWAPSAEAILPYLREIDANQWYTNNGPLVKRLEDRMGGVSVSSATLGLELAAPLVFRKKRVRIPAFTFVATATALIRAGFEPVLCDIGDDWALVDPDDESLAVCPFGASTEPGGMVDAAAAWGNQHYGARVFSLHATKALSGGEGGMICGLDEEQEARVRSLANFGLQPSTQFEHGVVTESGTNAKMSEYHAAVALASLDAWDETSAERKQLEAAYRERLEGWVEMQPRLNGVYTTFPVLVPQAERVAFDLASKGIETRRWYTPTLERHPAFAHLEREGALANCRAMNEQLLCLPYHLHMSESDVDQVCEVLKWAMNRSVTTPTCSRPITRTASQCTVDQPRA
ncbi:MAG: hypothetical protein QG602_2327 [Verrucomicrobiota bacterium]|nr:hypothetical protein [Verrucomicrobiota bacterium]